MKGMQGAAKGKNVKPARAPLSKTDREIIREILDGRDRWLESAGSDDNPEDNIASAERALALIEDVIEGRYEPESESQAQDEA